MKFKGVKKYNSRQAYSSLLILIGSLVVAFTRKYQSGNINNHFDAGQLAGLLIMLCAFIILMPWKDKTTG